MNIKIGRMIALVTFIITTTTLLAEGIADNIQKGQHNYAEFGAIIGLCLSGIIGRKLGWIK